MELHDKFKTKLNIESFNNNQKAVLIDGCNVVWSLHDAAHRFRQLLDHVWNFGRFASPTKERGRQAKDLGPMRNWVEIRTTFVAKALYR